MRTIPAEIRNGTLIFFFFFDIDLFILTRARNRLFCSAKHKKTELLKLFVRTEDCFRRKQKNRK
jgi:hypothetical protein